MLVLCNDTNPAAGNRNGDVWTYPQETSTKQVLHSARFIVAVTEPNPAIGTTPYCKTNLALEMRNCTFLAVCQHRYLRFFDGKRGFPAPPSDFRNGNTAASAGVEASSAIHVTGKKALARLTAIKRHSNSYRCNASIRAAKRL